MYASLVALDRATGGELFASPLHLIGHSRGTVVNSEIVQRLGTWNPELDDIHMTTLDPHDFVQDSLKVPLGTVLGYVDTGSLSVRLHPRRSFRSPHRCWPR
jgi:large repetitive protein